MLPYMVFKDPYHPWERKLGSTPSPKDASEKARVPWLALWLFQPHELLSTKIHILAGKPLFRTRSVRLKASGVRTPHKHDAIQPDEENSDAEFLFMD